MSNQDNSRKSRKCRHMAHRFPLAAICLAAILFCSIGGTLAFLVADSETITNTFTKSKVTCSVTEEFTNNVKSNVNVKNTGDTEAYIRVKLISYRVNNENEHIGGTTDIPEFTLGTDWFKQDGYYYYKIPVAPEYFPANSLIGTSGIKLSEYNDADGGKQVIEVMAEAIQSKPMDAVKEAWGAGVADQLTPAAEE